MAAYGIGRKENTTLPGICENPYTVYEYNASGNKIKETSYNVSGGVESERSYDAFGHETKFVFYDSDGNVFSWHEHEYDAFGNLIQEAEGYGTDGSVASRIVYGYETVSVK